MTDDEFATQKGRIQKLIDKWHSLLGLKWWEVRYKYARDSNEMPEGSSSDTLARCQVDWPYLLATMVWNMPGVEQTADDHLERSYIHEAMHILVREMRDDKDNLDHEERVCTMLAKAILWVKEGA